jgi:succinylglutamic semialdehyde dehydrogenase
MNSDRSASSIQPGDVDRVVAIARSAAFGWSNRPTQDRARILSAFAEHLRNRKSELLEMISRETGKPRWESATEVDAMIGKIALSIRAAGERRRPIESTTDQLTAATRYKPHGVVAVLGPFNFPGHLPNGHIAPALLAGNTVVFKPSEHTPGTADLTLAIWREAGLANDVLQIVHGERQTGEALVRHPGIDGVLFTGSFAAGRAIRRALADFPGKIAALEMGGNNPLIVWNAADLRAAAYMTIQSAYLSAGQRCSCARRLIIADNADGRRFIETLVAMISQIRVGRHTDDPEPFMGPVISTGAAEILLAAQQQLIRSGARALVPMRPLDESRKLLSPGLLDVTEASARPDEEYFGPLLQLIRVETFDEAIMQANQTVYGLTAGLLSDDRALYDQFFSRVRAGIVNFNRPLTGASSALPFGGIGASGNHRPSAYFAADYCSYPVASLESDALGMPAKVLPGIDL